jgi:hypothetical protein
MYNMSKVIISYNKAYISLCLQALSKALKLWRKKPNLKGIESQNTVKLYLSVHKKTNSTRSLFS